MSGRAATKPVVNMPWWLADHGEICNHCMQPYSVEVEIRCYLCDDATCGLCVVSVAIDDGDRAICPLCHAELVT